MCATEENLEDSLLSSFLALPFDVGSSPALRFIPAGEDFADAPPNAIRCVLFQICRAEKHVQNVEKARAGVG
jgi:hypothetical protein